MIRFGPAGIPLSCKGRTLEDGIEDVHNLGLSALEVQLVRLNIIERYPSEEEVGQTPRGISGELVVALKREESKEIYDSDTPIEPADSLQVLVGSIARDHEHLEYLGRLARELDVEMSLHTPYYMDLAGSGELTRKSLRSIQLGGMIAHRLGGTIVATHIGLYGSLSREEALAQVTHRVEELAAWYGDHTPRVRLGLETSGRQEVFGSLDEILNICEAVPEVRPVMNFAHTHARAGGSLQEPSDFADVLERVRGFNGHLHTHFSGVEHEGGNELRYTPIKRGDLRFEPLVECLLDGDFDLTVISSSPLLEHDAMYMKVILERLLSRRVSKQLRQEREEA